MSLLRTDHLVDRKTNHWDIAIRDLSARTLHKLTAREPSYMAVQILPKLFEKTSSIDINQRHGTVLAIGEIVSKLKQMEKTSDEIFLTTELVEKLSNLVITFQQRDQFKGKWPRNLTISLLLGLQFELFLLKTFL